MQQTARNKVKPKYKFGPQITFYIFSLKSLMAPPSMCCWCLGQFKSIYHLLTILCPSTSCTSLLDRIRRKRENGRSGVSRKSEPMLGFIHVAILKRSKPVLFFPFMIKRAAKNHPKISVHL